MEERRDEQAQKEKKAAYDDTVYTIAFDQRGRLNKMGHDALMDLACAVAAGKGKS